jgi:hypothetical protein
MPTSGAACTATCCVTGAFTDFLKALVGSTRAVPLVDVERVKQQQEQQRSRSLQEQTLRVVRKNSAPLVAQRPPRLCTTTSSQRQPNGSQWCVPVRWRRSIRCTTTSTVCRSRSSRTTLAPTLTRSALRHCWPAGRRRPFWRAWGELIASRSVVSAVRASGQLGHVVMDRAALTRPTVRESILSDAGVSSAADAQCGGARVCAVHGASGRAAARRWRGQRGAARAHSTRGSTWPSNVSSQPQQRRRQRRRCLPRPTRCSRLRRTPTSPACTAWCLRRRRWCSSFAMAAVWTKRWVLRIPRTGVCLATPSAGTWRSAWRAAWRTLHAARIVHRDLASRNVLLRLVAADGQSERFRHVAHPRRRRRRQRPDDDAGRSDQVAGARAVSRHAAPVLAQVGRVQLCRAADGVGRQSSAVARRDEHCWRPWPCIEASAHRCPSEWRRCCALWWTGAGRRRPTSDLQWPRWWRCSMPMMGRM